MVGSIKKYSTINIHNNIINRFRKKSTFLLMFTKKYTILYMHFTNFVLTSDDFSSILIVYNIIILRNMQERNKGNR